MYHQGKLPLEKLISKEYQLDQINNAFDALENGKILGRALIKFPQD